MSLTLDPVFNYNNTSVSCACVCVCILECNAMREYGPKVEKTSKVDNNKERAFIIIIRTYLPTDRLNGPLKLYGEKQQQGGGGGQAADAAFAAWSSIKG